MTSRALIVGASRGLGRALVEGLLARGHEVAGTVRRHEDADALRALGAKAFLCDVVDHDAVTRAVAAADASLGGLDLVVANAARMSTGGRLWETDAGQWWADVETNLRGPMHVLHASVPVMLRRGVGRILLVGSGIGTQPAPWTSAYGVSKVAVHRLADSVNAELAGTGVSVFAVSPGYVRTDMTASWPEALRPFRPDLFDPEAQTYASPQRLVELVDALSTGRYDALSGRFLHAVRDDLDALLASLNADLS